MNTHLIKESDTLSELAAQYGTTVATLKSLNAQQIKDIDMIYDGKTLILPDELDISCGERAQREPLALEALTQSQCTPPDPFVDALYVPEHPQSKKQKLILLTQKAKGCVIEDAANCNAAVSGDKNSMIKKLNELGVLEPFVTLGHEAFLRGNNPKLADAYLDALLKQEEFTNAYSNKEAFIPELVPLTNGEDFKILKSYEVDYNLQVKELNKIRLSNEEERSQYYINEFGVWEFKKSPMFSTEEEFFRWSDRIYVSQLSPYQGKLIEILNKKISYLENKAQAIAKQINVDDEGHYYEFSKKTGYTSNDQLEIYNALTKLNQSRSSTGMVDLLTSDKLTANSQIMELGDAYKAYKHWRDHADPALKKINERGELLPFYHTLSSELKSHHLIMYVNFFVAVYDLNQIGVVVREQCLTESELFLGHDDVLKFQKILETGPSIATISDLLSNELPEINDLGYYSAYVLGLVLTQTAMIRIRDFNKLIGENKDYSKYVRQLIMFVEKAKARCDALKIRAEQNKNNPFFDYKVEGTFLSEGTSSSPSNTLIWNEWDWMPKELSGQIYINSNNRRRIVECSLSSDPTKALYILSDNPVLSSELGKNCRQTKAIELNPGSASMTFKNKLKEGLIGSGAEFDASATLFSFSEEISESNFEDIVLPWRTQKIEVFGVKGRAETSGGAQFFRFLNSGAGKLNLTNPLGKTGKISASVEVKREFMLANGEAKVDIHFPRDKPAPLKIPYYLKESQKKKEADLGGAEVVITAKVYGFLAASMQLASDIHIGNTTHGELGIAGSNGVLTDNSFLSVGGKGEAKAFAGLEVGGSVDCQFKWYPPKKSVALNLFKVGGGMSMSLGAGGSLLLQCSFYDGKFILISDMGGTAGAGFKGKVAVELNPFAMDKFFGALFDVTKISGFSRFGFFDDEGRLSAFGILNDMITIAITFGLTLAQVALLPFTLFEELSRQASDKRNAFFIANFILQKPKDDPNNKNIMISQEWKTKMPPETLCRLLSVLINYNDIPRFGITSSRIARRVHSAKSNERQRLAILQLLTWITEAGDIDNQMTCFENTLQRMGVDDPANQDEGGKWQRYANNAMRLRAFFVRAKDDDYEDEKEEKQPLPYMERLERNIKSFMEFMDKLTERTPIYEVHPYQAAADTFERYNTDETGEDAYFALNREEIKSYTINSVKGYSPIEWQ